MELIAAALAAGAAGGVSSTTKTAIGDAYAGLKALLVRKLGENPATAEHLATDDPEPQAWIDRLGTDVFAYGLDSDAEVIAAASRVLNVAGLDPGRYVVNITENHGAAGTFLAPVTITNHVAHHPPETPGAP